MKTATRSFVLLAGMAVVGGVIAFVAYDTPVVETGDGKNVKRPFLTTSQDAIARIEITTAKETLALERRPRGWFSTAPVVAAVDDREVEKLARLLAQLAPETRFGEGDNKETPADTLTGLASPAAKVTLSGAEALIVELGGQSEFNKEVYARVTLGVLPPVTVTISASNASAIVRTFEQLVDVRATGADADRIQAVRVEPRAGVPGRIAYAFERLPPDPKVPKYRQERRFRLTVPSDGPADLATVNGIFSSLARSPANTVVTRDHQGDLAPYGLADPAVTVTLNILTRFPKAGEEPTFTRELRFSDPDADGQVNIALSDDTLVRKANALIFERLFPSQDALESKKLFDFNRDEVSRLEIDLGERGATTIERYRPPGADDMEWRMLAPEPGRAKAHLVSAIVLAFADVVGTTRVASGEAAKAPATLARYGLGEGARRVRFFDAKGEVLGTLLVGKVDGEVLYIASEGGAMIVTAPVSLVDTVPVNVADLIDSR